MLIRPALLAHEFAITPQSDKAGATVPEHLLRLWEHCSELGMRGPTADAIAAPPITNGPVPGQALNVLAVAKRPTDGVDLHQAVLSHAHDAVCLTVVLAPNTSTSDWRELDRCWPARTGVPTDPKLFSVRVYQALVAALDVDSAEAMRAVEAAVAAAVPDAGGGRGGGSWTQRWSRTAEDFLFWEAPARGANERRIVLIAQESAEAELDAFAWTSGARVLGPFIAYLLDGAKLRYEQAVYAGGIAQVRQLRGEIDKAVDRLLDLHRPSAAASPAEFVAADATLGRLQTTSTGLITTSARLKQIAHTIDVVVANMTAAVSASSGTAGPLAVDRALAASLREQVADDIAYLDISRERAERVSALTANAVQRGLSSHQHQLVLIQTSVIGAILMILAAVQAFGTKVGLPDPMQVPVIALLGSFALALPVAVLRWSRGVPRDLPLRTIDYVAVVPFGVSLGWLLAEIVDHHTTYQPSKPLWAAVAALVFTVTAGLRTRQLLNKS